MPPAQEVWLRGPVADVSPVFQPVAHALVQAVEDVQALAPSLTVDQLWAAHGAASAGFHLIHLCGALDRLFTYARGEMLDENQKQTARAEAEPQRLEGPALARQVATAVERAMRQLETTDPSTAFEARKVGRAGLPSTVLGLLFHAAEHTTRHVGQFITTVKLSTP